MPDWIEHDGRRCPVSLDAAVRIRPRNGVEDEGPAKTYEWDWRRAEHRAWQITHYQLIS